MNKKALLLLTLTLLAAISTIITVAATSEVQPMPDSFSTTQTIAATTIRGFIQPNGDPIDNPIAPS